MGLVHAMCSDIAVTTWTPTIGRNDSFIEKFPMRLKSDHNLSFRTRLIFLVTGSAIRNTSGRGNPRSWSIVWDRDR